MARVVSANKDLEQPKKLDSSMNVSLPSNGCLYGGIKALQVRPLTTAEVKYMDALVDDPQGPALSTVLDTALVKSPMLAADLSLGDRNYLLLWLRENTYSSAYLADWVCPRCGHAYGAYEFDLKKVPLVELPTRFREPIRLYGEDLEDLWCRLPRGKDLEDQGEVPDWATVYSRCMIPGENEKQEAAAERFLSVIGRARFVVSSIVNKLFHGPDYSSYPVACKAMRPESLVPCGWEGAVRVPFRREFFSPFELYAQYSDEAAFPQ